jgi:hypothetical protein
LSIYIKINIKYKNKRPIRLSYHGRSHYNSLKPINNVNYGLLENRKCGEIENDTLKKL